MQKKLQSLGGVGALALAALLGPASSHATSANAALINIRYTLTDLAADGVPAGFELGTGVTESRFSFETRNLAPVSKVVIHPGEFFGTQESLISSRRPPRQSYEGHSWISADSLHAEATVWDIPRSFHVQTSVMDTESGLTLAPHSRLEITATAQFYLSFEDDLLYTPSEYIFQANGNAGMRVEGDLFYQDVQQFDMSFSPEGELYDGRDMVVRLVLHNDSDDFKTSYFSAWASVSGVAALPAPIPEPGTAALGLMGLGALALRRYFR